ncbi:MAG: M23 family metallopeptidase [Alphaproteobacteria bacterium]
MMQEFDPRRPTFRIAPRALMVMAGCCAVALGFRLSSAEASLPGPGARAADAARAMTLQTKAFAESEIQPGMAHAGSIDAEVLSGETMLAAVRRLAVDPKDAEEAVSLLGQSFDTDKIRAGTHFQAAIADPLEPTGYPRLVGLSMRTGPATQVVITRSYDGVLRLRQLTEQISEETTIVQGDIEGSLSEAAGSMGATSAIVRQASRLFAHKVDFARDIQDGDTFKLVFTRRVTQSGRTVEGLNLLYAELDSKAAGAQPMRFYRFQAPGAKDADYYDETGKSTRGFLLQTPVGFARVTSGFGSRMHPVLGYTKQHTGIDFAGSTGTPIYASGDGTIKEAGWKGGYGNWIDISHGSGWDTGYAHMSRFAPGIKRGSHVSQGQLIGYVGATGQVTGPHLHYEVMFNGAKLNPRSAAVPAGGTELTGAQLTAFKAQEGSLNALLAQADQPGATRLASGITAPPKATVVVLNPSTGTLRN